MKMTIRIIIFLILPLTIFNGHAIDIPSRKQASNVIKGTLMGIATATGRIAAHHKIGSIIYDIKGDGTNTLFNCLAGISYISLELASFEIFEAIRDKLTNTQTAHTAQIADYLTSLGVLGYGCKLYGGLDFIKYSTKAATVAAAAALLAQQQAEAARLAQEAAEQEAKEKAEREAKEAADAKTAQNLQRFNEESEQRQEQFKAEKQKRSGTLHQRKKSH